MKRRHYGSFQRNGVTISVHDFVYVLAEHNKRLVAYLEDMYEDSEDTKMVVVRWYHTFDEVGLVLPRDTSHREVFLSLSLQDLGIECIDGLATVLSPHHFQRFLKLPKNHAQLEPFVCRKRFENDQVFPFDITRVKGYWKQDILRYINPRFSSEDNRGSFQQSCIDPKAEDAAKIMPPKKRQCRERRESISVREIDFRKAGIGTQRTTEVSPGSHMADKIFKDKSSQYHKVGSCVEVLSEDSGIRGCWFRASVIKKHQDKLKVRYEDIRDADDEANNLEEWISASRVASLDPLCLRLSGRLVVRPSYSPDIKGRVVTRAVDVGTVVDVWRHDAWWEGIVVEKQSDDKFRVFFPAEKLNSIFSREELRHSREWIGNGWAQIKERRDLVASIVSSIGTKQDSEVLRKDERDSGVVKNGRVEEDISKDDMLAQLKWKSSKKRRRCSRSPAQKVLPVDTKGGASKGNFLFSRTRQTFMISPSLKPDRENCKYGRESLFSPSVVAPLTSLVMSR